MWSYSLLVRKGRGETESERDGKRNAMEGGREGRGTGEEM